MCVAGVDFQENYKHSIKFCGRILHINLSKRKKVAESMRKISSTLLRTLRTNFHETRN